MWQLLSSVDWLGFFKAATGAGVGTAIVQGLFTWRRESRERRSQATHLAIQLAVILEDYARACGNFISDNGNADHPPDQEFPEWEITLPRLPSFPEDDVGWRALDHKLGSKARGLPGRIDERQEAIRSTIQYVEHELGEKLEELPALLGLEALDLAKRLRNRYSIEPANPILDPSDYLERYLPR